MLFDIVTDENVKYYKELVPDIYENMMFMPGAVCIGAAEETEQSDRCEAAGVLVLNVSDKTCMHINYLQVNPDYREQEIGTLLLKQAFELAKQMNIKKLYIKIPEADTEESEGLEDDRAYFFLRRGFIMTENKEREWWFSVETLKDYKKLEMGNGEDKLIPLSKLEPKIYRKVFEAFENEISNISIPFMYDLVDRNLSYAYVENGKLKGYFLTEVFGDTYYPIAFVNHTNQAKVALALLRGFLVCMAKNGNQSNNIHIMLKNETQRDAMEILLKDIPFVEMNILEAENDNMDNTETHIINVMESEELTKKEDEEFPKAFDVVEYEYYGGEIESVAD